MSGDDENDGGEHANTIASIPTVCRSVADAAGAVAGCATERGEEVFRGPERTGNPEGAKDPTVIENESVIGTLSDRINGKKQARPNGRLLFSFPKRRVYAMVTGRY
ncbi:MAG: hypothetical protein HGA38_04495 [Candidatus Moranbacteria bacterium]|nr:hypothetical protein [Candidatus Moranbacteria bacterium]